MRRHLFEAWLLFGLLVPAILFAAEARKTGTVKGTITIGGRSTADAVVSIEGLSKENFKSQVSGERSARAMIDQRDMKFVPRVLPVLVGTRVDFRNNDKTFHNVFSTSEAKKFDIGLRSPGETRSVTFDKPGVVRLLCNVHPNMEAYIVVKDHPYFVATDMRGNYQLSAVPLGKYRLEVWHPEFGTRTVPFELVREGEVLAIDVDLKKQR
jgi:plastocyanin